MRPFDFQKWTSLHQSRIEELLVKRFEGRQVKNLSVACQYPIKTGGKRFRPLLVYASLAACTSELSYKTLLPQADLCAQAVELIHTYSLVHDDLPCMDNDDFRRGHPTVHKAFSEDIAILVGDSLLTEAFLAIANLPNDKIAQVLRWLSNYSGIDGMVGGQSIDIGFEGGFPNLDTDESDEHHQVRRNQNLNTLTKLHRLKTGALIELSVVMGAYIAGLRGPELDPLKKFGQAVGLGFQLADDVLDAEEDQKADGPPSFVKLVGIDQTKTLASEQLQIALETTNTLVYPEPLRALARFSVKRLS
ncbi:MAG: polyprenyl synthetase family protein [Myxococcota bacterium]